MWDCTIAFREGSVWGKKTGLTTAYIERKKEIFNPHYIPADIRKTNLVEMAQEIIKL